LTHPVSISSGEADRERIIRFRDGDQSKPVPMFGAAFAAGMMPTLHRIDVNAGEIEMRFKPGEDYVAARSTIQGGAIATMLDLTMVFLALAALPDSKLTSTANMNVSYLQPAFAGPYVGKGKIERRGRTMIFARAELIALSGDPVATSTGLFPVFDRERTGLPR
jgi:uncharacterized protein (TIGR00369 family)